MIGIVLVGWYSVKHLHFRSIKNIVISYVFSEVIVLMTNLLHLFFLILTSSLADFTRSFLSRNMSTLLFCWLSYVWCLNPFWIPGLFYSLFQVFSLDLLKRFLMRIRLLDVLERCEFLLYFMKDVFEELFLLLQFYFNKT